MVLVKESAQWRLRDASTSSVIRHPMGFSQAHVRRRRGMVLLLVPLDSTGDIDTGSVQGPVEGQDIQEEMHLDVEDPASPPTTGHGGQPQALSVATGRAPETSHLTEASTQHESHDDHS